jgi:hypothetical protein
MPTEPARPHPATVIVGIVTVLMSALACGAAWAMLALIAARDLSFMALPVGVLLAALLRAQRLGGRWWSAPLAVLACALACVYTAYLAATADVASVLGLPLRSALPRIGPEMALAVAWARAGASQLAWVASGCVAAGVLASRRRRPASTS